MAAAFALGGCGGDETTTSTTAPGTAASSTAALEPSTSTQASTATEPAEDKPSEAPGGPDGETVIERNAQSVIGSNDPKVCDELMTERFVGDAYGGAGGCRAALEAQPRTDVEVSEIDIETSEASATAVPDSGSLAGEDIELTFLLEDGEWRVDSIVADVPAGP
ncbi:MAG: hypothetical protein ACR2OC_10265 [Solirubrobacterales bacterium]